MTRLRRTVATGSSVLVFLWSVLMFAPNANAAERSAPLRQSPTGPTLSALSGGALEDFSMALSPPRLVIAQADIGSVQNIVVANQGQSAMPVAVQMRNFLVGLDGGLDYQAEAPYSASTWVTADPMSFVIPPGSKQAVAVTVTVPSAPEPGDHQVALAFVVAAPESSANIKVVRGIAVPVFITVPGPIDDSAALSGLAGPGFAINGPVNITATVTNTGTVHRDFRGATALQIGGTPFPDFTVARDSIRNISTSWDPPLMCICHPSVSFTNADGSVEQASIRVIIFPVYWAGALILALLLAYFGMRFTRHRYRASVAKAAAVLHRRVATEDA